MNLEKIYTALVTPFNDQGNLDLPALKKLTDHLYQCGMRGFLIGGTTGESPTLTREEKEAMIYRIKAKHQDVSIM